MRDLRPLMRWVVVLMGSIMTLSGCTYAAIQKLSLEEQAEFHIYKKVMTAVTRADLSRQADRRRTHGLPAVRLAWRSVFRRLIPSIARPS